MTTSHPKPYDRPPSLNSNQVAAILDAINRTASLLPQIIAHIRLRCPEFLTWVTALLKCIYSLIGMRRIGSVVDREDLQMRTEPLYNCSCGCVGTKFASCSIFGSASRSSSQTCSHKFPIDLDRGTNMEHNVCTSIYSNSCVSVWKECIASRSMNLCSLPVDSWYLLEETDKARG